MQVSSARRAAALLLLRLLLLLLLLLLRRDGGPTLVLGFDRSGCFVCVCVVRGSVRRPRMCCARPVGGGRAALSAPLALSLARPHPAAPSQPRCALGPLSHRDRSIVALKAHPLPSVFLPTPFPLHLDDDARFVRVATRRGPAQLLRQGARARRRRRLGPRCSPARVVVVVVVLGRRGCCPQGSPAHQQQQHGVLARAVS
jgi:hypothetical protein